ncbi:uncharacterized protein Asalp_42640 [Aeromonas salmonicida subsp. pectinolytica 34mel]|uniref:Uncharacterized protein n=1 Tax=Aeromonas salmonicida subsp. pectinolytica 34mel TaxID=1324960 RepID=A0A2D1QM85_AERSA|nr:uncharacterized protein Asalp_42640 [Aeromonas salmonicida subsp. pectinolytica 34mel]
MSTVPGYPAAGARLVQSGFNCLVHESISASDVHAHNPRLEHWLSERHQGAMAPPVLCSTGSHEARLPETTGRIGAIATSGQGRR